ncbi:MAG: hypothetical protein ACK4SO_00970 [Candidatus Kapaibacteriota bacterium]
MIALFLLAQLEQWPDLSLNIHCATGTLTMLGSMTKVIGNTSIGGKVATLISIVNGSETVVI